MNVLCIDVELAPFSNWENVLFRNSTLDELKQADPEFFLQYDLLIINAQHPELTVALQVLFSKDKELTPLIISDSESDLLKYKHDLMYTPFIGNNIMHAHKYKNELGTAIAEGAKKTIQGRAFRKIKTATKKIDHSISIPENLKQVYLDKFFDDVPVGTILLDANEKILTLNNYARIILGIEKPVLKDTSVYDFFPDELSSTLREYFKLLPLNSSKVSRILELPGSGSRQYLEISGSHFKHHSEKEYYIVTLEDITEKAHAKQLLEQKVRDLEQMNEELERFAYIVSHDLRNPLIALNKLCEMAESRQNMDMGTVLKMIKASSEKLMHTVFGLESLIDINKNVEDQVQNISFQNELSHIKDDLASQLTEKGGRIYADFSSAPDIHYVKPYLFSIMTNLISNAIKYSHPERNVEIFLKTWRKKDFVVLSVRDNGIGIDLSLNYHKLFQPFVRLTNQASGKGVGLSLIKRMIEKNKGKIEVESTPGKGTDFICYLKEYQ